MVGMDVQLNIEKSKVRDCLCDYALKPCAEANGQEAPLCPITPNPRRENLDSVLESPARSPNVDDLISTNKDNVVAMSLDDSPYTPEKGVFDPFAPGPDDMLLAPIKKPVKESRKIVARRLDFDDVDDLVDDKDEDTLLEKFLLDTVYEALLEAFVLKQMEDFLAENHNLELEGPRTPTSPCRLTAIAEITPGAPVKARASKARNIDPGFCRKLEF